MKIEVVNNCKDKGLKLEDGMIVLAQENYAYFIQCGQLVLANLESGKLQKSVYDAKGLEKLIIESPGYYEIYKGKITIELTEEIKF